MICRAIPYEGREPYIFLSYCHKDAEMVYPILEKMVSDGYRVWYDDGNKAGDDWPENIAQHLKGAAICVAMISEKSVLSHNCKNEINSAIAWDKKLAAVMLQNFEMPIGLFMQLSSLHYLKKWEYPSDYMLLKKLYETEGFSVCKAPAGSLRMRELKPDPEQQAEEERRRKAEEERQRKAEEERQRKAEEERRRKAEEERQRKAEEERQRKAEEERQRKAEEERRRKAEEERQRKAEEEQRRKAEEERQRKAEEERRRKAEEERQRKAEQERQAELERQRQAEQERQAELERQRKAEQERQAELERQRKAEEEQRRKAERERKIDDDPECDDGDAPTVLVSPKTESGDEEDPTIRAEKARPAALVRLENGKAFLLRAGQNRMGRSARKCEVVVPDDPHIGNCHAEVIQYEQQFYLRDLNSRNGTFVKGEKISPEERIELENETVFLLYHEAFLFLSDITAEKIGNGEAVFFLRNTQTQAARVIPPGGMYLDRRHKWEDGTLSDEKISRKQHAFITAKADGVYLEDIGSSNGTHVNDQNIRGKGPQRLGPKDTFRMGDTIFEIGKIIL